MPCSVLLVRDINNIRKTCVTYIVGGISMTFEIYAGDRCLRYNI